MRQENREEADYVILPDSDFLEGRSYNIWNCYSEYASSFNNRLHFHDFYELSVIYEGSSGFLVNGNSFHMGKRSLHLVRPSDYHRQQTGEGEHIRYYNLMFSPDFISEELLAELEKGQKPLCASASGGDWEEILRLINRTYEAFLQEPEEPMTRVLVRGCVELLCVYLLKNSRDGNEPPMDIPQESVRKAINFIRKNYRKKLTLEEAAAAAGLSPTYFSGVFHRTMGVSFSRYLTDYRLKEAKRYLSTGEFSVKQIAGICGFSSYPYFVTAFRERYGCPPGAWQKREKKN